MLFSLRCSVSRHFNRVNQTVCLQLVSPSCLDQSRVVAEQNTFQLQEYDAFKIRRLVDRPSEDFDSAAVLCVGNFDPAIFDCSNEAAFPMKWCTVSWVR